MAQITDIFDLGSLGLKPGGGTRFDALVHVGEFIFGDQRYTLGDDPLPIHVDVSRTSSGYVIRLRSDNVLDGPCMRCYGDYSMPLDIDHSEIHEPHLEEPSVYVTGNDVDLAGLTRDAIGLNLPTSISSPVDEDGICTECANAPEQLAHLHDEPSEQEPEPDPRWAKLRELDL
jgi:uncharacterized protein